MPVKLPPSLANLERLLSQSAAQPHREEVSKALREAVNRGGMRRFSAMEGPIKRGMPEIPSDALFDYSQLGEPYSHLSARDLQLPATPKGLQRILPSLRSPNKTRETLDLMRAGSERGGHLWYNMRPLTEGVARERPDLDVASALKFMAPYSQSTPVENEIMQGLFSRYFLKKHGTLPEEEQISQALPPKYSAAGAGALERGRSGIQFESGAQPKMTEHGELAEKPKLYPYDWARSGDVRNPVMDRHVLGHYGQQAGLKQNPKNALGLGMQYQALDAGMMPTEAQAALWTERLRRGYVDESGDVIRGKEGSQLPLSYIIERLLGESAESIEKSKMQHILDVLGAEDYPRYGPKKFQSGGLAHLSADQMMRNIQRFQPRKYNELAKAYMRSKMPSEFRDEPLHRIPGGSGRAAFMMGDDKVAKLAQLPRGFAEMAGEGEPYLAESGLLPKALWKDPNDEIAILERIPHTGQRSMKPWMRPLEKAVFDDSLYGPRALQGPMVQRLMEGRDMSKLIDYEPLIGDFMVPYHWGFKQDVMHQPLQRRRGTLLDPGALQPDLTSGAISREYLPFMQQANSERLAFIRKLAQSHEERRAIEQMAEEQAQNPNIRLPGFRRGGPVKLAGGGDPARLLMLLNRAQKALGTESTIRSGGQRIPLSVAVEDLRGLSDDQLRKIADIYSQGSRSGYRMEDLKAMISDQNRNLGRIEELHDICQGPLGRRAGICFPERHFAGGGVVRNWLRGVKGSGIEEALADLRKRFAPRTAWEENGQTVEAAKVGGDKKYEAIQQWIDKNLSNYMVRQMGTEADPLRAEWRRAVVPGARDLIGGAGGNEMIRKIPAADVQRNLARNVFRDTEAQDAEMAKHPWLQKLIEQDQPRAWSQQQHANAVREAGDATSYSLSPVTRHMPEDDVRKAGVVELNAIKQQMKERAAEAESKYQRRYAAPIELHDINTAQWQQYARPQMREVLDYLSSQVRPESLTQVSVPQAFRGSRQWHEAMAKKKAEDLTQRMAEIKPTKEYPGGYRWLELGRGEQDVAQNIGKHLGHCFQDPETCASYLQTGKLAALMKGNEPRAVLEMITEGVGDPDLSLSMMRKQALAEGPWRIGQVRGTQKIEGRVPAPMPEDLPYVQDFIRSGKWEGVDELENAGFIDPTRRMVGLGSDIDRVKAGVAGQPYWTEEEFQRLLKPPKEVKGMAEGGLVDDNVFARAHAKYPELPHGLLKAVAQAESNMNPRAVGKKGERGLMQFMPATAKQYGVDPLDVESSVTGAGRYFTDLSKRFKEPDEMLAAYNWGPGNLSTYGMGKAPSSTRAYISKVLSLMGNLSGSPTGRALRAGLGVPNEMDRLPNEPLVAQADTSSVDTSAQDTEDALTEEELLAYLYGEPEEETV